ncbi:peroxiredoxin family protein [Elusimicrobiota bacterium]
MKNAKPLFVIGSVFLLLLVLVLFTRRADLVLPSAGLEGVKLQTLDTGRTVDLASCPTEKCLIAYVAPWCGVCRKSTALLRDLKPYLEARGVETRIVVGQGRPDQIRAYAREFGPDTLLDPSNRVPASGGVPQFIITSPDGKILRRQPGIPRIVPPPIAESDLREMAGFLSL